MLRASNNIKLSKWALRYIQVIATFKDRGETATTLQVQSLIVREQPDFDKIAYTSEDLRARGSWMRLSLVPAEQELVGKGLLRRDINMPERERLLCLTRLGRQFIREQRSPLLKCRRLSPLTRP